jgi:23S rRNA (uracil1939-C5)-methyltransferase
VICPHASRCPGCPLIELPYAEQLELKSRTVSQAFAPYAELARPPLSATVPAEPATEFRLRTKLVVNGNAVGLFARGSHDVVDIPACLVLRPRLAAVVRALRRALPLPGPISSLDLREADAGVLVTAAVPPKLEAAPRRELAERIAALDPNVASVAVSNREDDAPQLLGGALEVLVGPAELRHSPDPRAPWHYAAHGAFVQAHAGQLARLHSALEAALGDSESDGMPARSLAGLRVLELYAGSGALSLRLAARGARPTLVESFAPAVRLAERAAREQGLAVTTHAADAGAALAELARKHERFDAVIVNPPRRGLTPHVRSFVARLAPERLVYVSCDPETLARDAAHFAVLGYGLAALTPFDMIPQTDAVETLARFARREPPLPQPLAEDGTFVAVNKPPHEAMTHSADGSLLGRVRRLPSAAHAVTTHALSAEASGVCSFAKDTRLVSTLDTAHADASSEYSVLARGVLRASGTLPQNGGTKGRLRYQLRAVLGGHSLLTVRASGDVDAICRALARIGHPVLGDARHGDRRSNAHFLHRHGLERLFVHRSVLEFATVGGPRRIEAPLAPDLALVLARLGGQNRSRRDD